MFADNLPNFALTAFDESDGARAERADLLKAVNAANLLTGSGDPLPDKALGAILKELALVSSSEHPFDIYLRVRLSALVRGLWNGVDLGTSAAVVPAAAGGFVPRAVGPLVSKSFSEVCFIIGAAYAGLLWDVRQGNRPCSC